MRTSTLHPRLLDVGAVAIALLGVWLSLGPAPPVFPDEAPAWWWIDLAGGLVASGLLLLRRRSPVAVAVVIGLVGLAVTTAWLAGTVAAFALAVRRPWPVPVVLSAVSLAVSPVQWAFRDVRPDSTSWGTLGWAVLIAAAVIASGTAVRARAMLLESLVERAERAEREAILHAEAARTGERTRIAREMHDVLGHRLALVSMHAAALAHRRQGGRTVDPTEVDDALEVIRTGTQDALNDLRAILGVLRTDEDDAGRTPQPTLADLDRLLDDVRAAGAEVCLLDELAGGATSVPDECGRTLFRITQEALTNAARHAPGRPVEVRLRGRPGDDAELEVANPLPPVAPDGSPDGAGLVGIAERVELAGGEVLSCGPDGGSFRVAVRVPWPAAVRSTAEVTR